MPFEPFGRGTRMQSIFSTPYDTPKKKRFGSQVTFGRNYDPSSFSQAPDEEEPDDAMSYFTEMEKRRHTKGQALSAYQEHIQKRPSEDDDALKPSIWRRLAAIGAAGATGYASHDVGKGIGVGEHITRAPYERAVDEWGEKGKALGVSANLEREEKQDEMESLTNAYKLGLSYKQLEQKTVNDRESRRIAQEGVDRQNRIATLTDQRDRETDAGRIRDYNAKIYHERQLEAQAATDEKGRNSRSSASIGAANTRSKNALEAATKRGNTRRASPKDQDDAKNGALRSMLDDPQWKMFVKPGGSTDRSDYLVVPEMVGHPDYTRFQQELARRMNAILRYNSSASDSSEDELFEDPEIVIEPWSRGR